MFFFPERIVVERLNRDAVMIPGTDANLKVFPISESECVFNCSTLHFPVTSSGLVKSLTPHCLSFIIPPLDYFFPSTFLITPLTSPPSEVWPGTGRVPGKSREISGPTNSNSPLSPHSFTGQTALEIMGNVESQGSGEKKSIVKIAGESSRIEPKDTNLRWWKDYWYTHVKPQHCSR